MAVRHAVVQQDPGIARGHAGVEAGVEALDAGEHVALGVDDAKIGGVAGSFGLQQRKDCGTIKRNRCGVGGGDRIGQQVSDRHGFEPWISAITFAIEEGALLGFDQRMHTFGWRQRGQGRLLDATVPKGPAT